ncbi:N-6 DNA methylase (plasmid) [Achromobacter seleniivolatilans]|uniref:site-specific DNA-methyltransferase (adenine-specific) n=1 Tax=Achromobacter seleniivolatilans TaxID=3047478 RepID=A0ABY9MCN2_9BURK|nr:N-6 DNA methylase [Achromobacter sp. R39]WMD23938.1 N-6 DNA methylase [Achromobacter sp. R39]
MAKTPHPRHTDHHRAVTHLLESFRPRHRLGRVWEDFIASAACAISSAVEPVHRQARELAYAQISKRYSADEMSKFAECLAHVVGALEDRYQDFLGSLYMGLDLGNRNSGQFFTPYEVSRLMAQINFGENMAARVEELGGFVTLMDPCIGGGAMVIAAAELQREQGLSTHMTMHVTGVDIDITAVQMSYIQLSLLNVPAIILHGNSLSPDPYKGWNTESAWRTPAHCLFGWGGRLSAREQRHASLQAEAPRAAPAQETAPPAGRLVAASATGQLNLLESLDV